MDAVINRVVEIEKQSAMDIERAEEAYRKNIETHRQNLEKKKETSQATVISTENTRLAQTLEVLNKQTQEAFNAASRDFENRFHNQALVEAIKEKIVAILLTSED